MARSRKTSRKSYKKSRSRKTRSRKTRSRKTRSRKTKKSRSRKTSRRLPKCLRRSPAPGYVYDGMGYDIIKRKRENFYFYNKGPCRNY